MWARQFDPRGAGLKTLGFERGACRALARVRRCHSNLFLCPGGSCSWLGVTPCICPTLTGTGSKLSYLDPGAVDRAPTIDSSSPVSCTASPRELRLLSLNPTAIRARSRRASDVGA